MKVRVNVIGCDIIRLNLLTASDCTEEYGLLMMLLYGGLGGLEDMKEKKCVKWGSMMKILTWLLLLSTKRMEASMYLSMASTALHCIHGLIHHQYKTTVLRTGCSE